MINICITTYNRKDFLEQCIDSVLANTTVPYKLFVYDDGSDDGTVNLLKNKYKDDIFMLTSYSRCGITVGFNTLWGVSCKNNYEYFCYLQDDTVVEKDWLNILINVYEQQLLQNDYRVGIFSGHHAPEHPVEASKVIDDRTVLFKKSVRATNMIAPYAFWDKIGKIPLVNPDGSLRGFPGPAREDGSRGPGSNLDVYITGHQSNGVYVRGAAAKNCSWNLGTYCMVIPGLVKHMATSKKDSTWANENKEI